MTATTELRPVAPAPRQARRERLAAPRRPHLAVVLAVVVVLVVWNNIVHLHPLVSGNAYVPVNATLAGLLVLTGLACGLDRRVMGLGREGVDRSAIIGAAVVGVTAVGLLVALAVPALRPLLEDGRFAGRDGVAIAWHALGRVPFGTALLEEVAFRGVLLGLLIRLVGTRGAVLWSSLLFGLWHVRPAWGMLTANGVDDGLLVAGGVAASVVGTAIAGAWFCWLRLRTGHLMAPFVAHAGINGVATVAAYLALAH